MYSRLVWRGLAIGIGVAIVVMALELWMPAMGLSRGVQDALYRLPMGRDQEVRVIILQLEEGPQPMGRLLGLVAQAEPLAMLLSGNSAELEEAEAAFRGRQGIPRYVGVPYAPSPEDPGRFDPQQAPPPGALAWAPSVLPLPDMGVLRMQHWSVNTPEGIRPTLEGRLATELLGRQPRGDRFLVDFRGLQNRIPRVEGARVLRGEIPASLFRGRVVLVGRPSPAAVATPLDPAYAPITDLEFHAAAVHTVLRGEGLIRLPLWLKAAFLTGSAGLFYFLFRKHDPSRGVLWTLLGMGVQGLLGWGLLAGFGILWPMAPLVVAQYAAALAAQLDRYSEHRELLRIMVVDTGRHLPSHGQTAQEADAGTYWGFIGAFLEQFLQVNRAVFLVRSGAEPRVAEAWAYRCDLSAIREQRRDYRRDPYTHALKAAGPYAPRHRPFLHPEPGETQYLVPLVAYGEVEGFWVVALPEGADPLQAEDALKPLALQIAEMLHARRNRPRKGPRQLRNEFFSSLTVWSALRALRRQTGELDRHYRMLDALFAQLSTPSLIYDLFGRVVRKNEAMEVFLSRRNIRGGQLPLPDLVQALTGTGREEVQLALRHAILHREGQIFRASLPGAPRLRLILRPLALDPGPGNPPVDQAMRPFGLEGLVLEVDERGEAMPEGAPPLEGEAAPPVLAAGGLQRILDWTHVLEHEQPMGRYEAHRPERADAAGAFRVALEEVDDLSLSRRVAIHVEGSPSSSPVVANAADLPQVFGSVLYFLVEDARKDTTLKVEWSLDDGFQILSLANEGHGLPAQAFQSLLEREAPLETPSLRSLAASRRLLETWGARLEAKSVFGDGTRVRILLQQHRAER